MPFGCLTSAALSLQRPPLQDVPAEYTYFEAVLVIVKVLHRHSDTL